MYRVRAESDEILILVGKFENLVINAQKRKR